MPEILSWLLANPVRWVIPAILLLALAGVPVALWREKHRPTVPAHVAEMRAWRRLSTGEQAAVDEAALEEAAALEGAAVVQHAEEAARVAVERATEVNALFHP